MNLARGWLSTCVAEHKCAAPAHPPSRLLNVGTETRDPFLEDFSAECPVMRWAALSYCWGSEPSHNPLRKLTRDTVDSLKKGIALHNFDATVRDAILVTRALGISHIWVDALCIFQDVLFGDWETEFSKMSAIYGDSTVTLIPLDSESVTQGFLGPREVQDVAVNRVIGLQGKGEHPDSKELMYITESWDQTLDKLEGPWSKRAWTLQEGLLLNCLLYYSSSQIVWKCCESIVHERGVSHMPPEEVSLALADEGGVDYHTFDLFTKFKLLDWAIQGTACDFDYQRYDLWYEIVEQYSLRCMSDKKDRLLAISGLSVRYGHIIGDDEYCLGLWKNDLARGLLWRVADSQFHTYADQHLKGRDQFPSWSWASIQNGVRIVNEHMNKWDIRPFAEIMSTTPFSFHSNQLRAVIGSRVTLRGPVFEFPRLYYSQQEVKSARLSALERHLSNVIDH